MVKKKKTKKNKIHTYAAYERLTSDLKTHRLKCGDGKRYPIKMEMKRKLG